MTGKSKPKSKLVQFERQAGKSLSLKRAAARPAAEQSSAKPDAAGSPAPETPLPGFLSHKEIILRLVETLKAL